ncbi:MAG: cellulose synthase [Pseudanabaena frigida]|uniref:Cellulose synthase n=1 Tax=Pseudanabaena frigida TaxID=945775 RepID=A0A2W4VYN9_9CYAN|nr:MAG: cellulose synthase [Pseudanabaena frigida]
MTSSTNILENAPSFIGNMRSRLKKRTLLFRYLAEINLILGAWYLIWRINNSINIDALWLAIPLLLAEIYSFVGGAMFTVGLWRPLEREVRSLDQMRPVLTVSDYPTVDIFVTCYNEPVEMVEETARAALAIEYPANKLCVYILDDGSSDQMRSMSQRLAIEDLRSPNIQAEAARIENERAELETRLKQLQELLPITKEADDFLKNVTESHPAVNFLQTLRDAFVIIGGKAKTGISVSDRLLDEHERLENEIRKKERESSALLRCRYIARTKIAGKPHHAKAGNINHAIFSGDTNGSFILTLDADHIPKPQFLKRVLPYFFSYNQWTGKYEGNRIAFVQTPQDFYNLPEGDPYGHSAHLFYGPIQQGKDGLNSAFYTGTNAVLRREALLNVGLQYFSDALDKDATRIFEFDLIGGMSSSSITEDMNTAMRLHGAGWQSAYHNELLAEGLAPDDLVSTLKQRLRWAQGTIQVLVQENPLTKAGLSFWQRLQYFQTMYSYFSGFFTLIFILCPIIFFFTGIIPVKAFGADFAIHFFPAFIINRITFLAATWGIPAGELWRSEQYAIALFPLFIQAVWSVFSRTPLNFQVTSKQRLSGKYLNLVIPQLTIVILTLVGMTWCLIRFMMAMLPDPWIYLINGSWAIYNICLLSVIIRAAVWQPKES